MSDNIPLLREELQRLHEIVKRPDEAPGKGKRKSGDKEWAKQQIAQIHVMLFGGDCEVQMMRRLERLQKEINKIEQA